MSMPSLDPEETPLAPAEPAPPRRSSTATRPSTGTSRRSEPTRTASRPRPAEPARDGWSLIALVPYDGREPPAQVERRAGAGGLVRRLGTLASCRFWHARPSCRGSSRSISPSPPGPREIRVIAGGACDQLPSGYRTQAEDAGAALLESGTDRADLIRQISGPARSRRSRRARSKTRA